MKTIPSVLVCTGLILTLFLVGCAKPPTEEMNKAAEAVTRAENNNDAVTYAGNFIARARDALSRMYAEAEAKRYDAARSYAAEAIAAADLAISDGRTSAARAREEAAAVVSQLPPLIAETEQGIKAARDAKLALDFNAVDRDFTTACDDANQAQSALSQSRYQEAIDRGRTARAELNDINQKLSGAVMDTRRK